MEGKPGEEFGFQKRISFGQGVQQDLVFAERIQSSLLHLE